MLPAVILLLLVLGLAVMAGPAWRALRRGGSDRLRALIGLGLSLAVALGLGLAAPDSQKMLSHLIMPTGWVWLGLLVLSVELVRLRLRGLAALSCGLWVLYSLCGNVLLGTLGLIGLQSELPLVDWRQGPAYDAVLVLGGGTKPQPEPARFGLAAAGDRVLLGARLYRRGRVRTLVCSGRGVPGLSDEDLTEATHHIWMELGVPDADIVRLRSPYNTKEELEALAGLMRARGWTRVGLLSSGYHLPRAMAQARRLGMDLVPLRADEYLGPDRFTPLDMVPRRGGFGRTQAVVWEYLGRLMGR